MKESIEKLSNMPSKIKALQMDILKNSNKLADEHRKMEQFFERMAKLEDSNKKAFEIQKTLTDTGKLDGKEIIEKVISITQEVQMNMIHKEEFLDLKAETGEV